MWTQSVYVPVWWMPMPPKTRPVTRITGTGAALNASMRAEPEAVGKPHWAERAFMLIVVGVPGAYCAAMGGGALGAALFGPEHDEGLLRLSIMFLLVSPVMLLHGTGTTREPLFVLVFMPMPFL